MKLQFLLTAPALALALALGASQANAAITNPTTGSDTGTAAIEMDMAGYAIITGMADDNVDIQPTQQDYVEGTALAQQSPKVVINTNDVNGAQLLFAAQVGDGRVAQISGADLTLAKAQVAAVTATPNLGSIQNGYDSATPKEMPLTTSTAANKVLWKNSGSTSSSSTYGAVRVTLRDISVNNLYAYEGNNTLSAPSSTKHYTNTLTFTVAPQ